MQSTTEDTSTEMANYYPVIVPISMICILIALFLAGVILALIICIKRLHTVTHLLVCNAAIASIFYCVVQSINYIFLAFLRWETGDFSCRWRGYFGYMTVAAIVYSYLAQAISRFLIAILSFKYRWAASFKTHRILLLVKWILVISLPLPALVTEDIYHRAMSLCWVPKEYTLHLAYTIIAYYLIPTLFILAIYIYIYLRVKRRKNRVFVIKRNYTSNRDLELLFNIVILFMIYIFGALPAIIYIIAKVDVFYAIGLISVSLAVALENFVTLIIDRDLRNIIKDSLSL